MKKLRILPLFVCTVFILIVLSIRILYIGISDCSQSRSIIKQQSSASVVFSSVRKEIFDRNMIPLTSRKISVLNLTPKGKISEKYISDSKIFPMFSRYSKSSPASHLLGYNATDGSGLSGVEKKLDNILKTDKTLSIFYESDAGGNPLDNTDITTDNINPSQDGIKLTIDYHIQRIAETVMDEYIPKGATVIIDINTFEVIAMVSRPDFDSSDISEAMISEDAPLLNRAICEYNAGSVFKIITACSLLEKDFKDTNSYYYCTGTYDKRLPSSHVFNCHKKDGHGYQLFSEGFANSCNCTFYDAGLKVGGEALCNMAKKFGFGKTHLNFNNEEASGNIMKKDEYSESDILNMSIGQGDILITPLQAAIMAATIANNGIRQSISLTIPQSAKMKFRVVSEQTAEAVRKMMRECVLSGTARQACMSEAEIAGKTGSAETGWETPSGEYAVHGWFCGFFPYSAPKYAMAVFSENGKSGTASCVEPFTKICEEINKIYPLKQ
ncbi:MAG: penicillin-binding protein 2 [Clostridia bacterium]|nr:penicillin-binding protein 2 [Clostridia bacterium]